MSGYVELHARSALSFLRGASRPEDLSEQAAKLELPAMALCDRDGLYGAARHHVAAKDTGIDPLIGAELTMEDGCILPVLVATREGYRNLSRLITEAKLRGTKTECAVRWEELPAYASGLLALTGESDGILQHRAAKASEGRLEKALAAFGQGNVYVEVQRHLLRGEERRQQYLEAIAARRRLPIVATNGVMYHEPARRSVQDVFACIRHHTSLSRAGRLLSANGERFLKSPAEMQRLFADHPEYLENTLRVAERMEFRLGDLGYEFPRYPVPEGETMEAFLRRTTMEGARRQYGSGLSEKVRRQLEFELNLICRLGFAGVLPHCVGLGKLLPPA